MRIAELVNHFAYRDEAPRPDSKSPIAVHLEVAAAPWQPQHRLVRIHLKARERGHEADGIIARNLQAAVRFNPKLVAAYRRIGGDNASPADPVERIALDGREISAGYAATELYEIVPMGSPWPAAVKSDTGWRQPETAAMAGELLAVTMKFQPIDEPATVTENFTLADNGRSFDAASADFKFTAAVAGFGMLLRDSPDRGEISPGQITAWARTGRADDASPPRAEFLEMVRDAGILLAAGGTGSS